jgi:hypothetical protein
VTLRPLSGGGYDYPRVLRITNAGRVGIGNNISFITPASMLTVGVGANALTVDELWGRRYNDNRLANVDGIPKAGACIGFNASRQSDAAIGCTLSTDPVTGASTGRNGGALIWADDEGGLSFTTFPSNGGASGTATGSQYYYPTDVVSYRVMKLRPKGAGQVQIGPAAPPVNTTHQDYRLAVDGKLVAKSVFVTQASANWADFVFAPSYALQPLPELEAYLKQNRHLPAIPAAAEVERNGIDLGEMNARLLQSLEELTLHVIALGKQNQSLQAEVAALAARVNATAAQAGGK